MFVNMVGVNMVAASRIPPKICRKVVVDSGKKGACVGQNKKSSDVNVA
jgi:hypothetical protein